MKRTVFVILCGILVFLFDIGYSLFISFFLLYMGVPQVVSYISGLVVLFLVIVFSSFPIAGLSFLVFIVYLFFCAFSSSMSVRLPIFFSYLGFLVVTSLISRFCLPRLRNGG